MESNITSRMVQFPFFSSLTLTFISRSKVWHLIRFVNISQTVRNRANITFAIKLEVGDDLSSNAVHHDLDLHFQGNEFRNVNISKTVGAGEKRSSMTFVAVAK